MRAAKGRGEAWRSVAIVFLAAVGGGFGIAAYFRPVFLVLASVVGALLVLLLRGGAR